MSRPVSSVNRNLCCSACNIGDQGIKKILTMHLNTLRHYLFCIFAADRKKNRSIRSLEDLAIVRSDRLVRERRLSPSESVGALLGPFCWWSVRE